ncbi:MAG TPA: glycosyltransferase family protein [Gemmataceae bacterium]|nr:glycosyltransferase family protein [Gemmataceae bacterium]
MKVVSTIEARMRSSRLPGKVLRPAVGKPMLELLIERLRRARRIDQIVVATTGHPSDDAIDELARRLGVGCFRGSEEDVLDRVLRAAQSVGADLIVEITGDCPLADPEIIDDLVDVYRANSYDYVANVLKRTYPAGLDIQVFATAVLAEVARLTQDPADREHVSLYIYEHPERYRLHNVESDLPENYWDLRLTLDTPEDYELLAAVYEELYPRNPAFRLDDVLRLLDRRPDLRALNAEIQDKPVR